MKLKIIIDLLGFKQAQLITGEDIDGNEVEGVFIPLKYNDLKLNKGKILARYLALPKRIMNKSILYDLFFLWSKDFKDRMNLTSKNFSFIGLIANGENLKDYFVSKAENKIDFDEI